MTSTTYSRAARTGTSPSTFCCTRPVLGAMLKDWVDPATCTEPHSMLQPCLTPGSAELSPSLAQTGSADACAIAPESSLGAGAMGVGHPRRQPDPAPWAAAGEERHLARQGTCRVCATSAKARPRCSAAAPGLKGGSANHCGGGSASSEQELLQRVGVSQKACAENFLEAASRHHTSWGWGWTGAFSRGLPSPREAQAPHGPGFVHPLCLLPTAAAGSRRGRARW